MKTLLTKTYYYDILINFDNVTFIERAADGESVVYFVNEDFTRIAKDFDELVEELNNNG